MQQPITAARSKLGAVLSVPCCSSRGMEVKGDPLIEGRNLFVCSLDTASHDENILPFQGGREQISFCLASKNHPAFAGNLFELISEVFSWHV